MFGSYFTPLFFRYTKAHLKSLSLSLSISSLLSNTHDKQKVYGLVSIFSGTLGGSINFYIEMWKKETLVQVF